MSSSSTSAGGSPRNGSSRSSGGTMGCPERGRPTPRRARPAAAPAPRHTRARPSPARARSRSARPRRRRARAARPRPSLPRPPLAPLHHRDDLRQRGEPVQHRMRVGGGTDHRQRLARVAPAPNVAGHLAPERGGHASDQLPRAVDGQPAPRRAARPRGRAPRAAAPPSSARSPARSAAGRLPRPRAAPRRCGRRAPARARPSAWRRARGSGPGPPGRATARAPAPRARRSAGLHQLAQPRLDRAPDPSQLAHAPGAHQLVHGRGRRRGSSPRRGGRREPCTGWRPRARAATRRPPGGRRSRSWSWERY